MHYIKVLAILILVPILFITCSEDTPLEPTPSANKLSTFSEIQKQVFDAGCNTSGCHAGNNPAANLNLTPGNAYNQLVDVNSQNLFTGNKRVEPNNSANSVLILTMRSTNQNIRMPLGGTALSSATIDSIAKWIDEGAQNN